MSQRRIYSLAVGFATFSFAVFAVLWFYFCNRYYVLHYHEHMQLFRFDWFYFYSYLIQPGGLSGCFGAFLTQFYYYPVAGSIIIACVLAAVFLLFYDICRSCGNIRHLFFIPFIPAVLLMMSFVNTHFDMSSALGILFALAALRTYIAFSSRVRYWAGFILFTAIYFVAGGNALLLSVLMIVFELAESRSPRNILHVLLLIAWSAALPWLARQTIYTVPVREAYFALTPGNFLYPTISNMVLWLSFPVLYLFWRFVAVKLNQWQQIALWKIIAPNCLLAVAVTAFGAHSSSDSRAEILERMAYEIQHENWDTVMSLGKDYPDNNRLACYFTNIALAESGQMPYRMFHYRQLGVAGLFLDWQLTYFTVWYFGEIYYRLGLLSEAEHCAFEALSSSPKEPNVQSMRRLVTTNIARRDSATAVKYMRFFERSFAYRSWAQEQRANLTSAMNDTLYNIPDTPIPQRNDNFFMSYQQPDYVLLMLLQTNPEHRLAFEYLMAYYMLQKDIERVILCMNNFFENFDYADIPVHYEEALVVYKDLLKAGDEFYIQYPVSLATRERFDRYFQAYKAAQGNRRGIEQLEKQFGNTYWFYVNFIDSSPLQKRDEKNRY